MFYFIGFGFGAIFYFLPDSCGRKRALSIVLVLHAIAAGLATFVNDIITIKVCMFVMGLF